MVATEKGVVAALTLLRNVCVENEGKCKKCILRNAENGCAVLWNSNCESYGKLMEWEIVNYELPRVILN